MKYSLLILGVAGLLFTACQQPRKAASGQEQPVSFHDPHTQSNPDEVQVKHLKLDISVHFRNRTIQGCATWMLDTAEQGEKVIFDTYGLAIDSVRYLDGKAAAFKLGPSDPILGSPLRIDLQPQTKGVKIYYRTGQDATALQWLNPAQTFGRKSPFLYTQSESIYARSWLPCMDGPGIRFTYEATVKVPKGLMALMSAENPQKKSPDGVYHFKMKQPIPAYLMALAVGDIAFQPEGAETGVYAEPAILEKAHFELAGLEEMVQTAEKLYGPYRWGRYDVLVLPLGFPMGGMENPRLTFCTPTILAGDRSLVNLIAHELAHSWSGNLVTNATWNDFWLNEGFTTYFERRIMEAMHGKAYADMLWVIGYQDLKSNVAQLGAENPLTCLKLDLKGKDPDLGFTDVPYEKGAALLQLIEQTVGRQRFDTFLRKYFDRHAFQTMTTEKFLNYLDQNLLKGHEDWKNAINIKKWVYEPGIPSNYPIPENTRFDRVDRQIKAFLSGTPANALTTDDWTTYEWLHFLRNLPTPIAYNKMKSLDSVFHFTTTGNSEIADIWYLQSIRSNYSPAFPEMKDFLYHTGREKFLEPLYRALMETPKGRTLAKDIYEIARPNYHPLAQKDIDDIVYAAGK